MEIDDTGLREGAGASGGRARRASDALVGRVIAGRYQVERTVSLGANTIVVDATDSQVSRLVTLKLIRPEFSEVPEFRRRFDQTMRAMSVLSHPNIAAIFDWGETSIGRRTTVYAVVEYLGAGSLRDLFDRGRNLSPSQALVIGLEACRALDYAHRRKVVHSEVTPSKLVFGDDRRLRVIDFGLARLLGMAAWREPATVATHTARYASPEQALGQPIDGKTDVYALALCLIEAVTSSVPFAADSTVATLSGRVGKLMSVSADLGSLASVLERAGRPDRADRWTAAEFGRALVGAAEKLSRPEPLPLMTTSIFTDQPMRRPTDPTGGLTRPAGAGDDGAPPDREAPAHVTPPAAVPAPAAPDVDVEPAASSEPSVPGEPVLTPSSPTALAAATRADDDATTEIDSDATTRLYDGDDDATRDELAGLAAKPAAPGSAVAAPPRPPDAGKATPPTAEPRPPSGTRRRRIWPRVAVAVLLAATLAGLGVVAYLLFKVEKHPVPNLVGQNQAAAASAVEEFDWDIATTVERSDDVPTAGDVIRTSPAAGEQLAEGEPLLLVVSEGPELRELPNLVGMTDADARTALAELQLRSTQAPRAFHEGIATGSVVSWRVVGDDGLKAGDEVLPDTAVEITRSKGPRPREVPDLRAVEFAAARTQLDDLGLVIERQTNLFSNDIPAGQVMSQRPPAGRSVERGATIEVWVSKGPDLVRFPDLDGLRFRPAVNRLERAGYELGNVLGASVGRFRRARIDGETVEAGEQFVRGTRVDLSFF